MTVMAILQDVDKCMRCNGCVVACKREWDLKLFDDIEDVKPASALVSPRQRMAIKSVRRGDMGPFMRFSCWHCSKPPCAAACPFGAIKKESSGAVSVNNALCKPDLCEKRPGYARPCEINCQRGGWPKVGHPYEASTNPPNAGFLMNKCTLCHGRAGSDDQIVAAGLDPTLGLPTRATQTEINAVPEKKHEPACVSSCPAKAMKWDTSANIQAYLETPANGFILADGTKNWVGGFGGSLFWASRRGVLVPPKADPFIEDHIAPMASSLFTSGRLLVPTLVVGGLAALSARRTRIDAGSTTVEEV